VTSTIETRSMSAKLAATKKLSTDTTGITASTIMIVTGMSTAALIMIAAITITTMAMTTSATTIDKGRRQGNRAPQHWPVADGIA